jgi:SAM-dependent methyltransferase
MGDVKLGERLAAKPKFLFRAHCPVCGTSDLLRSAVFDALPVLCNSLYSDAASAAKAETARFEAAFCRSCGHFFNAAFDEQRITYTQNYENSLHSSPTFNAYADELATRLANTYGLAGKTVVDIGCGKGEFLTRLCDIGDANGIGFDKSFEDDRLVKSGRVRFVKDWFDAGYANLQPSLVTCRHVLEHVPEPVAFLRALRDNLGHDVVLYLEVPNALYTLRDEGIWDLIYEHVSYFTYASLRAAVEAAGFEVLADGTAFKEQYLYVEARPRTRPASFSRREAKRIEPLVRNFDRAYTKKLAHWQQYLAAHDARQCVVWGAGSKGITFANVVPGGSELAALVDLNPHKHGRFAPGTGTRVVAPEALRQYRLQSIIVMNPIYRDEIAAAARHLDLPCDIVVA